MNCMYSSMYVCIGVCVYSSIHIKENTRAVRQAVYEYPDIKHTKGSAIDCTGSKTNSDKEDKVEIH